MITITMFTDAMKVWEEVRAVLPEEVTRDWNHFVEIFGRFFLIFILHSNLSLCSVSVTTSSLPIHPPN